MSIIFGMRKAGFQKVQRTELLDLSHATDRYASDGTFLCVNGQVGMGFDLGRIGLPQPGEQRQGLRDIVGQLQNLADRQARIQKATYDMATGRNK